MQTNERIFFLLQELRRVTSHTLPETVTEGRENQDRTAQGARNSGSNLGLQGREVPTLSHMDGSREDQESRLTVWKAGYMRL